MSNVSKPTRSLRERFYYWRRRRAELALADAKYELDHWGYHPGTSPSELDAMKRNVEKRKVRLRRLEEAA
jgi:hypothetical protein